MKPGLQPVVVGSLLHSTNKTDFSVPQVKMRYVTVVMTMKQVCFRSLTLLCVTASSEMCLAQLWDLDDCRSSVGPAMDEGKWQCSKLWAQAEESVCGRSLNNIETTFPRLRPQVQCKLSGKAPTIKVKNIGAWSWNELWLNNTCGGVLCKPPRANASVCVSASVGAEGEAHTEVPYRAGFYGDLRKAVTRSGSFSGLISVLPQRRTCVRPPHLSTLPAQSDRHGWTQAANKTRIRRVSTHTGL